MKKLTEKEIEEKIISIHGRGLSENMKLSFIRGAKFAEEEMTPKWIDVRDELPIRQQRVMFIAVSSNSWYDGRVFGGTYTDPDFCTPGMGFGASHWLPMEEVLPELPKSIKPVNFSFKKP